MKNKYFIKNKDKESLELEELFLDSAAGEDNNIEIPLGVKNIKTVKKLFFLVLLALVLQATYLQIVRGGYYTKISENNYKRIVAVKSSRGIIYDRNNKQIVFNMPIFDLVIIPYDFLKDKDGIKEKIKRLSEIIEVKEDDLIEKINKADRFSHQSFLILENIEKDEALILEEKIKRIDGVNLEKNAIRNYVDSKYISNIIGYSGRINEKELKINPNYLLTDTIGKDGLEFFYEKQLRGEYGKEEIEVDSFGKKTRTIGKENPKSGNNLILNINSGLQKKIYNKLNEITAKFETEAGASVVALNPKNGAVLALVNFPSYDNNLFAKGISNDDYNKLLTDKTNPLLNKPIAGQYPPGSTFKPLLGAAALQEEIISPRRKIFASGAIYVGSYRYPDWKAHGLVDLTRAIAQSCNVYFYTVGGGYGDIEGLGIDRIKKYANLFGLGNTLGIDLPGEKTGLIPDRQWKKDIKDERWYIGDTYHVSIGQGDILATPLQIANYTAVIANGGKLFQPQIVDKIIDSDGNIVEDIDPKIIRENFIDSDNIKWIQKGMRENVISGSGISLSGLSIEVAGKTGTAQYYGNKKTHAWYIAYAPYDDPEIALAIIIEGGGEGHAVAVPVAKEVLEWYFKSESRIMN
ncbi:penicillin-binding protein 2 [Candidatus Parcubacteria bacterium]|nr:penicillin-binding protein 2 [Candidatus Parcubacteria bacterium]